MWTDEVGLPSLLATSSRQGFVESSASGMGGESAGVVRGGKDSSKMHSDGRINLDWRAG
jgi:hypothetical protein